MVFGDEVERIVFGLELEVLVHSAEEIADMQSARRLYARKDSQVNLLISKKHENAVENFLQN